MFPSALIVRTPQFLRRWLRFLSSVSFTRRWSVVVLVFCGLVWAPTGLLYAQEAEPQAQVYRVETTGGEVVIGTLVAENEREIVLDTRELGEVTVDRKNIESMEEVDPERFRDGEFWFSNPHSTRYYFAPNALGIPRGEGYYQNAWIFFNNVNYGASDRLSVGAGTVPIFLFGVNALPIWVLPKVSFSTPQENLHLAGGAVFGGVLAEEVSTGVGLVYGSATLGTRDHNATVSLGYGYTEGGFANRPTINVSGMTRVGRTLYLISENYFVAGVDGGNIISAGIRWAPKNFAVDFALARPLDADEIVGIPWLGVSIPFGQ